MLKRDYLWLEEYLNPQAQHVNHMTPNAADAVEERDDRDADEFVAASWAVLDDMHTLFSDRAAGGLDFFTRMKVDGVRKAGNATTTIAAEAKAGLARTWCDTYSLHMATS